MAKTTVNAITTRIKRRIDYDISGDSDLDNLVIDAINDSLKQIFQWLVNAGAYVDTGDTEASNVKTTADQAYIDISTHLAAADSLIQVSERTNDKAVEIIPYHRFVELYPDPTADSATTADHAALWDNRLYLGPTPDTADIVYYVEFTAIPADVAAGGTLPFKSKYDPLVIAVVKLYLKEWLDDTNRSAIVTARESVMELKHDLIVAASRSNINEQAQLRGTAQVPYFAPKKVI